MPSVTFLGTGPGDVSATRFQASILLQAADQSILLDAGEPCCQRLLELGFSLPDLDEVWITHAHSDHTGGLPMFLQGSWLHGRREALPVGVPLHLAGPLRAWLDASLLPAQTLVFPLEIFAWQTGSSRTCGQLAVTPHPTTHLESFRRRTGQQVESFLFEIVGKDFRILYSGDLGSPLDLAPHLDRKIDLLICELAHFSPEDLASALSSARVEVLCLTHLARAFEERRAEIQALFEESLPGVRDVYLPDDGESVDF